MNEQTATPDLLSGVTATLVAPSDRGATLPKLFGAQGQIVFENFVYDLMAAQAVGYNGGFWDFLKLSNAGFYMRPQPPKATGKWRFCVRGNGYEGDLTADAAGIVVCMAAYSHLSFRYPRFVFGDHFHLLRAFALDHPEAGEIIAALD